MAQNGQAVQAGQHDVQDDEVRVPLLPHLEPRGPASGNRCFAALKGEIQLQPLGDMPVVFDDEDAPLRGLFHAPASVIL